MQALNIEDKDKVKRIESFVSICKNCVYRLEVFKTHEHLEKISIDNCSKHLKKD